MELVFPKLLTIGWSSSILGLCHKARNAEDQTIIFDLSKTDFITPFGITLLAGTILECLEKNKAIGYKEPTKRKLREFLKRIGFYFFFQLPQSADFEAYDTTVQLKRLKAIDSLYIDKIISVFGHDLKLSSGVKDSLKLSLNETITNVFDHSNSLPGCFVCAQSYRNKKNIKLCITDFGNGIFKELSRIPKYKEQIKDSYDAIRLAVQEGVTSRPKSSGGFGLSHIMRFLRVNKGQITIISGDGKVRWRPDKRETENQKMPYQFQGTIVDMKINYDKEGIYLLPSEVNVWEEDSL